MVKPLCDYAKAAIQASSRIFAFAPGTLRRSRAFPGSLQHVRELGDFAVTLSTCTFKSLFSVYKPFDQLRDFGNHVLRLRRRDASANLPLRLQPFDFGFFLFGPLQLLAKLLAHLFIPSEPACRGRPLQDKGGSLKSLPAACRYSPNA